MTTLQAASGAGYPGVPSWDLLGNVIPFIDGEEQKIETETPKILGVLDRRACGEPRRAHQRARPPAFAVLDGHTESVSVEFAEAPDGRALAEAFRTFRGRPQRAGLPSAPASPIVLLDEANRPQPRLDVDRGDGHDRAASAGSAPARCSTTSSWPWATTPCAAPLAPPSSTPNCSPKTAGSATE